jgi:hypothetical protein
MTTQVETRDAIQLAIFASPRMGNTWLRALLKTVYDLADFAAHGIDEIPWDALPSRHLVNLHYPPSDALHELLGATRAIVIARHPIDALISVLHYSSFHPGSNGWVGGAGGNEDQIRNETPISRAFRDYALSPRAAALFSVTAGWWHEPGVIRTKYEALIADTEGELQRLTNEIGAPVAVPIEEAVAACAFGVTRLKSRTHLPHAWRGQPGLWRSLIPATFAREIFDAHRDVFDTLGYECEADETLTHSDALSNWLELEADTNKRDKEQLWNLVNEWRLSSIQAQNAQKATLHEYKTRLAATEKSRLEAIERLQKILTERNEFLKQTVQEKTQLAQQLANNHAKLVELSGRLIEAEASRQEAMQLKSESQAALARLHEFEQTIARLTAQVTRSEEQLERTRNTLNDRSHELSIARAQLAGTGQTTRAIARKLTGLSHKLPRTANSAMHVLNAMKRMRRAA